ncbi:MULTISPECIES: hypothetical protein [Burkholderia]|uniref:hypothetical protein n=1 Tax=Burkholderia TaxID=32008 RepID=UPI001269EC6E|nr:MULTISPECIES: hypothetical protein [Burkholderia]
MDGLAPGDPAIALLFPFGAIHRPSRHRAMSMRSGFARVIGARSGVGEASTMPCLPDAERMHGASAPAASDRQNEMKMKVLM